MMMMMLGQELKKNILLDHRTTESVSTFSSVGDCVLTERYYEHCFTSWEPNTYVFTGSLVMISSGFLM